MLEIYQGTGCQVFVAGYLHKVPKLYMDKNGTLNLTLQISRKNTGYSKSKLEPVAYYAILLDEHALKIRQFGFPGLHLSIQGDLQSDGKIIVEEINFLNSPISSAPCYNLNTKRKPNAFESKIVH